MKNSERWGKALEGLSYKPQGNGVYQNRNASGGLLTLTVTEERVSYVLTDDRIKGPYSEGLIELSRLDAVYAGMKQRSEV